MLKRSFKFATLKPYEFIGIQMNKQIKIYVAVVLSMIFWSFSFIWFKVANKTFHPITIVFNKTSVFDILMTIFLVVTKNYIKIKKSDRETFPNAGLLNRSFTFSVRVSGLLMFRLLYVQCL